MKHMPAFPNIFNNGEKKKANKVQRKRRISRLSAKVHEKLLHQRRERIKSFKSKMNRERNLTDKVADLLTSSFGTVWFITINALWFAAWILFNSGFVPGIPVFDPYPYGLLTMIVSLEAIFLAIIVLISQNRAAKIADLREEIALHIGVKSEQEITKLLILLGAIHDHLGLPIEDDEELVMMKQKTDMDEIEKDIVDDIKANE
jgi:uncharacterized membrane protein